METFIIEGTHKTPAINFDPLAGKLEISGRSISEHPIEFYQPLTDMISKHTTASLPRCVVTINLEYFSTSSSRCIFILFKDLEALSKQGSSIEIKWMYEKDDEEMLEAAEDFQALLEIPFQMIAIKK